MVNYPQISDKNLLWPSAGKDVMTKHKRGILWAIIGIIAAAFGLVIWKRHASLSLSSFEEDIERQLRLGRC